MSAALHPAATPTSRRLVHSNKPSRHRCCWLTTTVLPTVPCTGDSSVISYWGSFVARGHVWWTKTVVTVHQIWSQWLYKMELLSRMLHNIFTCLCEQVCTWSLITKYKDLMTCTFKKISLFRFVFKPGVPNSALGDQLSCKFHLQL